MARTGAARSACLLSPAGFINDREGIYARAVLMESRRVAKLTAPHAELLCDGPVRRTLAFSHLVARPWRIPADQAAGAMRNLGQLARLRDHLRGDRGLPLDRPGAELPVTVAWGDKDRLLIYSRQAPRARRRLPERAPRHAHRLRPRADLGRPGAGRARAAGSLGAS